MLKENFSTPPKEVVFFAQQPLGEQAPQRLQHKKRQLP
jgi:hypothetical protein